MASSSSYACPKLGPNPPLLCLNQLYAVSMWNIKLYYSIGVRVTLEELVPVCISVALIGRIPEGGRIRLDHGSRRQSRWIADFPWSRRGSLLEISHFPPHYYTSYLKDGAQIPMRRNLCSSPNPKFILELTKPYKKGLQHWDRKILSTIGIAPPFEISGTGCLCHLRPWTQCWQLGTLISVASLVRITFKVLVLP